MKYIIYISLLLFTYSCKTKKAVETPASKLWQSGIDTITLPVNDTITLPSYGSELVFDSGWITVWHNTNSLKSGILKRPKKTTEQWMEIDENDTGVNTIYNAGYVTSDTATLRAGDSLPKGLTKILFLIDSSLYKPVYDTLKTIVSYVDTSVEARPNVIDWKYLYYVRRVDVLFSRDNYYLELDKKRIKSSIVILEARILDPK